MNGHRLTVGTICSGIGGAELALDTLGFTMCAWQAEIDPYASRVLSARWPDVRNIGDITTTDWTQVEPVDAIAAGYPCQGESVAGLQKGADDERWLWPAVRAAIRTVNPRWVFIENVANHLRVSFPEVVEDLAGLGFDAEWGVYASSDIGACHRRRRLWVVAANRRRARLWPDTRRGDRSETASGGRTNPNNFARGGSPDDRRPSGPVTLLPTVTTVDGRTASRCVRDASTLRGVLASLTQPDDASPIDGLFGEYAPAVHRWTRLFRAAPPSPFTITTRSNRVLNPAFAEWMMGYPAGWVTRVGYPAGGMTALPGFDPSTETIPHGQQIRCVGNAIQPQTAVEAWGQLAARFDNVTLVDR